jgi:hypothetical protein
MGNNQMSTGLYQTPRSCVGMNEIQVDRLLRNEAIAYIKQAPTAFATRTVVRAIRLDETIGVWWNAQGVERIFGRLGKIASQRVMLLFILGRICIIHISSGIVTFTYFTVVYATFVIQDRYHVPTRSIMAIFAAYAIFQTAAIAQPALGRLRRCSHFMSRPKTAHTMP